VETWLTTQRALFGATRKSLTDLIKPFRGKS